MCVRAWQPTAQIEIICVALGAIFWLCSLLITQCRSLELSAKAFDTDIGELRLLFLKPLIYGLYLRGDVLTGSDHG